MTLGSREGIGVDGRRNSSRKPEGCEEEEDGETGSEDRDTKGDGAESLHPSTAGSPGLPGPVPPGPVLTEPGPGSAPPPLTSTEPTPPSHDQHHFLRSSVRPPSKRIRKDSVGPAGDGPGGSRSRGKTGDHLLILDLGFIPRLLRRELRVSQTAICCNCRWSSTPCVGGLLRELLSA